MEREIPVLYKRKEECCGCTACYAICPKEAISMVEDARCFTDVQAATACNLFDVASSGILNKFVGSLVNKRRIHNVISFRGWHSE